MTCDEAEALLERRFSLSHTIPYTNLATHDRQFREISAGMTEAYGVAFLLREYGGSQYKHAYHGEWAINVNRGLYLVIYAESPEMLAYAALLS